MFLLKIIMLTATIFSCCVESKKDYELLYVSAKPTDESSESSASNTTSTEATSDPAPSYSLMQDPDSDNNVGSTLSSFNWTLVESKEEKEYRRNKRLVSPSRLNMPKPTLSKQCDIKFTNKEGRTIIWDNVPRSDFKKFFQKTGNAYPCFLSRNGLLAFVALKVAQPERIGEEVWREFFPKHSRGILLQYVPTEGIKVIREEDAVMVNPYTQTSSLSKDWFAPKAISNDGRFLAFEKGDRLYLADYHRKTRYNITPITTRKKWISNLSFSADIDQLIVEGNQDEKPETIDLLTLGTSTSKK